MFDSYVLIKLNSHSYKIQFILDFWLNQQDKILKNGQSSLEKSEENEFQLPNIIQTWVDSEEIRRKLCFGQVNFSCDTVDMI